MHDDIFAARLETLEERIEDAVINGQKRKMLLAQVRQQFESGALNWYYARCLDLAKSGYTASIKKAKSGFLPSNLRTPKKQPGNSSSKMVERYWGWDISKQ